MVRYNLTPSCWVDLLLVQIEQTQKDSSSYATLERQYEDMIKEVRDLEGILADYNLSTDKMRSNTDPAEVMKSVTLASMHSFK